MYRRIFALPGFLSLFVCAIFLMVLLLSDPGLTVHQEGSLDQGTASVRQTANNLEVTDGESGADPGMPTTGSIQPIRADVEAEDVLVAFVGWAESYAAESSALVRSEMEEEGIRLALKRRGIMKRLIREDPRSAIEQALPAGIREEMAPAILAHLERPVSGKGTLEVFGVVPDLERELPERLVLRTFRTEEGQFEAFVYGRREAAQTQRELFLHGIAVDRDLAVSEMEVRIVGRIEALGLEEEPVDYYVDETPHLGAVSIVGETRRGYFRFCCEGHVAAFGGEEFDEQFAAAGLFDPVPRTGATNILVMLAVFPADASRPWVSEMVVSRTQASATMAQVNTYFRDTSYRQFSFSGIDITEQLVLPEEWSWYMEEAGEEEEPRGPGAIIRHAREVAYEEGFFLEYDFAIVVFPQIGFPWGGLGAIGAKGAWTQGNFSGRVIAHELGHNLGLFHAAYWEPSGPAKQAYPFRAGRWLEYGNRFDVMGGGQLQAGHFSGNFKSILGWIPPANQHRVAPDEEAVGAYRIYRLDSGAPLVADRKYTLSIGLTEEQWPLAYGGSPSPPELSYWLDFRQLFTTSERAMEGVIVQWGQGNQGTSRGSRLLNLDRKADPWPSSVLDAALLPGETFYDRRAEVLITPLEKGGVSPAEFIDVVVTRGTLEVDVFAPVADFSVVNPSGELLLGLDEVVLFSVGASASGSPLAAVELFVDGEPIILEPTEVEGMYEVSFAFSSPGGFTIVARATNEAGNFVTSEPLLVRTPEIGLDLIVSREWMAVGDEVFMEALPIVGQVSFDSVEFFANGERLAAVSSPFEFEWWPEETGHYRLRAIAYDSEGQVFVSRMVELVVHALALRVSSNWVSPGQTLDLNLEIRSGEWEFEFVDFFVNGELLESILTPPYQASWVSRKNGVYNFTAVVRDIYLGVDVFLGPVNVQSPAPFALLWPQQASVTDLHLNDLVYFDGRFVAIGQNGVLLDSSDGSSWSARLPPTSFSLKAVAHGLDRLVAVGDEGTTLISTDGHAWTSLESQTSRRLTDVVFGDGFFVAVGEGGRIRTLSNAVGPWIPRSSGTESDLRGVAYGDGIFVAVGSDGKILTSADGIEWTTLQINVVGPLYAVTYGDGVFVAVGGYWDEDRASFRGTVLTSSDGRTWTDRDPEIPRILYGVAFGEGIFAAVGSGGTVALSADAISWVRHATLRTTTLLGVTHGQGRFVAVGRDGAALRSGSVNIENWFAQYFTSEERQDPEIGSPGADPGGFGIPNLMRYAFGLNPRFPERAGFPEMVFWADDLFSFPAVSFTRLAEAKDVVFILEESTDLLVWVEIAETEIVSSIFDENKETVLIRSRTPLDDERKAGFLRLRIEWVQ